MAIDINDLDPGKRAAENEAIDFDALKSPMDDLKPTDADGKEISATEDVETVALALEQANQHGLNAEVITWALYHALSHPNASIRECMFAGLSEWDV